MVSNALSRPVPASCRAIVAIADRLLLPPVTHAPVQPSAYPTMLLPFCPTVASMKSSRLRHALEPPPIQIPPRWTGSFGVASTVVHVDPPSYVVATYRCQVPPKPHCWSSPP